MSTIAPGARIGDDTRTGPSGPPVRHVFARVLAKAWWVVVAGFVIGAAAGFVRAKTASAVYQANVVVVATSTTIPADNFGSLATTAFETDTVLDPVVQQLNLNTTAHALVARGTLSVEPVSGAAAIRIIGRAGDRDLAASLANTAAQSFVSAATRNQLGEFSRFGTGAPGTKVPVSTVSNVVRDAVGGVLLALLVLMVLYLWRRPVMGREDLERDLPADVVLEATMRRRRRVGSATRSYEIFPRGTALAVWRAVAPSGPDGARPCFVLVESKAGRDAPLLAMMEDMITAYWANVDGQRAREPLEWRRASDEDLPAALVAASAVVALVSEGVGRASVRRLDAEIALLPGGKRTVAVLIR